jgi:glycosyltransferase involved in cell wall biosynthesis
VLEAMARNVPVATSNRGSLAEVAGDAALLFDPTSAEDIATTVSRLLKGREMATAVARAGAARARQFSWSEAANLSVESYARTSW